MKSLRAKLRVGAHGLLLAALLAGCGGGGGGPSAGSCDATTYQPNYVTSLSSLQHWAGFPLRVFLGPTDAHTRQLTLAGFNQWVNATGGRVNYILVNTSAGADVTVSFDLNSGQAELGVTTTTFSGSELVKAGIKFFFVPPSEPDADLINQTVAAHEFGHALGIGFHSPNPVDLMFAQTNGSNNVITTRDLNTLLTAYCNTFPLRETTTRRAAPQGPLQTRTISTKRAG